MYRVSDVLRPDFARSWYEAVAIVQEVAAQLVPGASVPGPEDLLLDRSGVLQLGFGPDGPQNQVEALGSLLDALLEGIDAPSGLRTLASDNAGSTPAISSVEAFQRALAFYERPGRAADLESLAARLTNGPGSESPEAEFERLRERLANHDAEVDGEEDETPVPDAVVARKPVPRQMVIAASVLALATIGAIVVYARPHYLGGTATITDHIEQKLADTISTGLNKMATADASSSASAAMPAEASEPAAGRPVVASTAPGATPVADAKIAHRIVTNAAAHETFPPALSIRGQLPATLEGESTLPPAFLGPPTGLNVGDLAPMGSPSTAGHADTDGLVTYSEADNDVEPPRINRQQLPRQPEPGVDTGYFDVIISESGIVERVQLVSPMRRFQERMLMAAAKAWTFKPAMRYGQPVRYRLRIAIILSDKP